MTRLRMIVLAAAAVALGFIAAANAAQAPASAQLIVHLLDYVSVDYGGAVTNGKVADREEYREQQEFAAQVRMLLSQLPDVRERGELLGEAARLKARIDALAPSEEISKLASDLRWRVIGAYDVPVVPNRAPDFKRAAALYATQCAGCHGASGYGNGPAAKGLEPAPADFHDKARMAHRSAYGLYNSITLGVKGTAMRAFSDLSDADRWALAFHVAALGADEEQMRAGAKRWEAGQGRTEIGNLRALATLSESDVVQRYGSEVASVFNWLKANPSVLGSAPVSPIAYARTLLAESVVVYRAGKRDEAQRLALSAYLEGFELAEATLDAVDRNLRQEVEGHMIEYRDLLRRGVAVEQVAAQAARIDRLLDASAKRIEHESLTPTAAALSAFLILVREGLEALLVIAAIVAFLVKTGRREALRWIHAGWIAALALGLVTWFAAVSLIRVSGATRELTEGVTALLAALILLYVGFWLHAKRHAAAWKTFIQDHVKEALQRTTLWALAGVSFLAVYREAFETVLFFQALWQQAGEHGHGAVAMGFAGGVATLALIAVFMLRYGVRLPIGPFFTVCSILMAVLAVIFTGQGIKALQEADMIGVSPIGHFSVSLLGLYPTAQTIIAQLIVLILIVAMFMWSSGRHSKPHA